MKYIVAILVKLSFFTLDAQDTLFLSSGEMQIVELISINKTNGTIIYKYNDQQLTRAISSVKSYTNHAAIVEVKDTANTNYTNQYGEELKQLKISPFTHSKFSVGLNTLSLFSGMGEAADIFLSTNYNQSFYGQYTPYNWLGVRLPARIGFNQRTTEGLSKGYIGNFENVRELFYEVGIEPIFMLNDKRRINPYLFPGIYYGLSQGIRATPSDTNTAFYSFAMGPKESYYRVAFNVGVQMNLWKHVSVNFEVGGNVNTARPWYYYPFKRDKHTGIQAALNIVYRFNGRKKEI